MLILVKKNVSRWSHFPSLFFNGSNKPEKLNYGYIEVHYLLPNNTWYKPVSRMLEALMGRLPYGSRGSRCCGQNASCDKCAHQTSTPSQARRNPDVQRGIRIKERYRNSITVIIVIADHSRLNTCMHVRLSKQLVSIRRQCELVIMNGNVTGHRSVNGKACYITLIINQANAECGSD